MKRSLLFNSVGMHVGTELFFPTCSMTAIGGQCKWGMPSARHAVVL